MPIRITTNADECYRQRIRAGLSARAAATAIGLSAVAIRNIERGFSQARPSTLKAMAELYGCDIAALIREDEETAA